MEAIKSEAETIVRPEAQALLSILETLGYGGLILDRNGRVLRTNHKARRYLGSEMEFRRRAAAQAERVGGSHIQKSLREALRAAAPVLGYIISVPRTTKRPLLLWSVHLSGEEQSDPDAPAAALVLLDMEDSPQPDEHLLTDIFGLTPAECRVARLLSSGESLLDISRALGVSVGTIRSQLKAIFWKTGTSRQGELIALLAHLAHLQSDPSRVI